MAIKQTGRQRCPGGVRSQIRTAQRRRAVRRGVEPGGRALLARPQRGDGGGPNGAGADGLFVPISSDVREEQRRDQGGDSGNPDPRRVLRRLAQGVGCLPHGEGGLGGRRCRRRKGSAPKRDGFPHRCSQRRLREVLYRSKLSRAPFHRAGRRLQRDV